VTSEEARAQFPVLERFAYLNAGAVGPLARTTVDAIERRLRLDAERGRGSGAAFEEGAALRDEARSRLAAVLGVDAGNVALTTSTTRSCNVAIAGLGLGPDDEVVTTDGEHFGLLGPLHASGARVRVAAITGRPALEALETILAEIGPRTRLVGVSHVSWLTGHVLPLDELRAAVDVPILVDGAQSAGAIPVDATVADFYTVSGQKWLCGPDATGALYVADPEALRVAAPGYLSQQSYAPDGSFVPREGAARFDSDWLPAPSVAGLIAALAAAPDWRYEAAAKAAARCRELLGGAGLEVVTEQGQATLVTFVSLGDPDEAVARADDQGVIVRRLPDRPWLRVSCGYWTNEDDLERLVTAVR
jgi:L-cysteine/cystine lyase